jgi:predicted DNA-binding WGR domain protein
MARYEFEEGTSSKFWEIELDGTSVTTRWGRIGTEGQSKTKPFATEAAAKKEHDKLVAEKTKKGYVLAGAAAPKKSAAPAKPKKAAAKPAKSQGFRRDVYLTNDSGAWTILSAGVVGRIVKDARKDDAQWAKKRLAIPLTLVGDDSFVVRVVLGEPLEPAEAEQWIARVRAPLEVSGKKLVISAGLDPDVIAGWKEEGDGGTAHSFAVPDGEYLVSVYTYLHTMNGRVFVGDPWEEKLGAWFRRDHKKRAFPSWVAGELHTYSEEDPGHEKEWRDLAASVKSKKLAVEIEPLNLVGFVVHLEPLDGAAELSEPGEDGFFPETTGLRKPARFPLGVPSELAEGSVRSSLQEILPAPPEPPVVPVDVVSLVRDHEPKKIAGGPVELPVASMARLFWLAFLATDSAHPEIVVALPKGAQPPLE